VSFLCFRWVATSKILNAKNPKEAKTGPLHQTQTQEKEKDETMKSPRPMYFCPFCGRIKKYMEWIELSEQKLELQEAYNIMLSKGLLEEVEMTCPDCERILN